MRRPIQFALVAAVVVLAIVAAVMYAQYQKASNELASTQTSEQKAQERYNETINTIAEIQDSLNAIAMGDTGLGVGRLGQPGTEGQQPSREATLERISVLKASVARNLARVDELESRLKRSGIRLAGLQKMINNLRTQIREQETVIARVANQRDDYHKQVTGLTATVAEREDTLRVREQTIEDKRRELATVYYVVGTKKELERSGVVRSRGGVLGIGQTLQPSPSPNNAVFTPLDTDQQDVIRTEAENVRVLSAQPATSYYLKQVDGKMEVHIVKPDEFRRIKQVVILAT